MTHTQLPCDLLPPHLAELCCGEAPRFTAAQCFAHANAWQSQNGLPELTPLEVPNAEPTAKVHDGKLVQIRIDEQVVRKRRDESPKQTKPPRPKQEQRPTLPPCVHLLDVIREEGCRLCGGRHVIAPIHGCGVHGECTQNNYGLKGSAKYLATCITCLDYSEIGGLETVREQTG